MIPAPLARHLKTLALSAAPHLQQTRRRAMGPGVLPRLARQGPGRPAIGAWPDSRFRLARARRRFVALVEKIEKTEKSRS